MIEGNEQNRRKQNSFDYVAPEPLEGPHGTPSILTQPEWSDYVKTFTPEPLQQQERMESASRTSSRRSARTPSQQHRTQCYTAPGRLTAEEKESYGKAFITQDVDDTLDHLTEAIKRELLNLSQNTINSLRKILMSQYHIDANRTLPVFVLRDELSHQKVPLSGSTFSVLCNMFTHANNEIVFEGFLDFIEAVLLDKPIEFDSTTLPALRYDDRCQTAPGNVSISRFQQRPIKKPITARSASQASDIDMVNDREVLLDLKSRPSSERSQSLASSASAAVIRSAGSARVSHGVTDDKISVFTPVTQKAVANQHKVADKVENYFQSRPNPGHEIGTLTLAALTSFVDTLQKQFQSADRRLQGVLSKSIIISIIKRFNVPVSQNLLDDILG